MNSNKQLKDKIIWLIEDEIELAETYLDFLSPHFGVRYFDCPSKAESMLGTSEVPDLIVTDIKMPKRSGLSFVKDCRARGLRCPSILISGFAEKAHALEAINLGVSGFMEKPLDPRRLLNLIKEVIRESVLHCHKSKLIDSLEGQVRLLKSYNGVIYDRLISSENAIEKRGLDISSLYHSVDEQIGFFHLQNELQGALDHFENEIGELKTKIQKYDKGTEELHFANQF